MTNILEKIFVKLWNWIFTRKPKASSSGFFLGLLIRDDQITKYRVSLSQTKRTEHILVLGRTGSGKSSLVDLMAEQDIKAGRGFLAIKFHDDHTRLLSAIAAEEGRTGKDLSEKTIIIDPSDPRYSVGLNPLEIKSDISSFVQISELAATIRNHCHLESFGPQTEELLRNSLHVLSDNGLTLTELAPLLTNSTFRSGLTKKISNAEVRSYFENRFGELSAAMRGSMVNPVLNKTSAFTADPHFRHILGQKHSTFSLIEAIDSGSFVILALPKNRLGEQAAMLGSLLLAKIKNSAFGRAKRNLFSIYADEIQNLVASQSSVEVMLSELRKFGIGMVAASQYLDQYPPQLRSAVLAIGTHICFQLSSADADKMASAMDGGKGLSELLRNLPQRHFVIKSGSEPWKQVVAPKSEPEKTAYQNLYERCRRRWANLRTQIEQEIIGRAPKPEASAKEALDGWE